MSIAIRGRDHVEAWLLRAPIRTRCAAFPPSAARPWPMRPTSRPRPSRALLPAVAQSATQQPRRRLARCVGTAASAWKARARRAHGALHACRGRSCWTPSAPPRPSSSMLGPYGHSPCAGTIEAQPGVTIDKVAGQVRSVGDDGIGMDVASRRSRVQRVRPSHRGIEAELEGRARPLAHLRPVRPFGLSMSSAARSGQRAPTAAGAHWRRRTAALWTSRDAAGRRELVCCDLIITATLMASSISSTCRHRCRPTNETRFVSLVVDPEARSSSTKMAPPRTRARLARSPRATRTTESTGADTPCPTARGRADGPRNKAGWRDGFYRAEPLRQNRPSQSLR